MNPFEKLQEVKVFKDPVHRYIHVDDKLIWDLIGTSEFQRLRRIKQLGTAYVTFHGAEHSRFSHSLGVYEITRIMIDDVFTKRREWTEEDRMLCLCAALLHDVGHGPFSHSFEKVFHLDHEQFSQRIIREDTEINRILGRVSKHFPQQVADVIGKTSNNKLAISMISSQIDADRMDYLLRDAYFTGVNYGKFDLERLLRVMYTTEDGIIFKKSGMHAVEHYVISRYQMYWQVYFHPVSRSAEVILLNILKRVKYLVEENYQFGYNPVQILPLFHEKLTLKDYLKLDDGTMMYYFQVWQEEEDSILADLCKRFSDRKLFKYVQWSGEDKRVKKQELDSLFIELGINPDFYLTENSISDLPYDLYGNSKRIPILLHLPDGSVGELSEESYLVESISGKVQTDTKLFYPTDLLEDHSNREIVEKVWELLK